MLKRPLPSSTRDRPLSDPQDRSPLHSLQPNKVWAHAALLLPYLLTGDEMVNTDGAPHLKCQLTAVVRCFPTLN